MNNSLDFGKALTYMFEEPDWIKKGAIALLVAFLSVLIFPAFLLTGYQIEIMRNVMRGQRFVLPNWEGKWGDYFRDGIFVALAGFVYMLPAGFVFCLAYIPLMLGSTSDGEASGNPIVLVGLCLMCLAFLLMLPLMAVYYIGMIRFAETGELASFFDFSGLIAIARERAGLLGMALVATIAAGLVGGFIPVIGTIWAYLATAHALGQVGRTVKPFRSGAENAVYPPR